MIKKNPRIALFMLCSLSDARLKSIGATKARLRERPFPALPRGLNTERPVLPFRPPGYSANNRRVKGLLQWGEDLACDSYLLLVGHSSTWSARSRTDGGIVRPSAFAVLRLITSSNFVGCSTGRSAGLAPLRILST